VLAADPIFVDGRVQREDRLAAYRRRGETGNQRQKRLPLERGKISVLGRRRNGIEERHLQELW